MLLKFIVHVANALSLVHAPRLRLHDHVGAHQSKVSEDYFLKLAKKTGLDSVICDPFEKTVMDAANGKNDDSVGKQQFLNFAESISG